MSAYKIFTRQINFNIKFLVKHSDSNDDDEGDDDDDADASAAPEKQTPAGKPAKRKAPKQTLKTKKKKQ